MIKTMLYVIFSLLLIISIADSSSISKVDAINALNIPTYKIAFGERFGGDFFLYGDIISSANVRVIIEDDTGIVFDNVGYNHNIHEYRCENFARVFIINDNTYQVTINYKIRISGKRIILHVIG